MLRSSEKGGGGTVTRGGGTGPTSTKQGLRSPGRVCGVMGRMTSLASVRDSNRRLFSLQPGGHLWLEEREF